MYVITGGGSGIGRALAHALSTRGKHVLICGRRQNLLEESASFSEHIRYCVADVSTSSGRNTLLSTIQQSEPLEGLVHNAGIIEPMMSIEDITPQDWEHTLAVNLNAPLYLSQALLSSLNGKRVLHIGSGAAYFPVKGWSAYCVSKAALSMLTRCWQHEYQGTLFASVMPGIIDTDMQAFIRQGHAMDKAKLDFFKQLHQDKRLINPETVGLFLSWLLLDLSDEAYCSKEWDIYDTSHHPSWLMSPHEVPHWDQNNAL